MFGRGPEGGRASEEETKMSKAEWAKKQLNDTEWVLNLAIAEVKDPAKKQKLEDAWMKFRESKKEIDELL